MTRYTSDTNIKIRYTFFNKKILLASVITTAITATAVLTPLSLPANAQGQQAINSAPDNSKQVFSIGNNWDGTVTVIRPDGDYGQIGTINAR